MPFKFSWLCELLDELYQQAFQQRTTYARHDDSANRIVRLWYNKYNSRIDRSTRSAIAILSALLPERRSDRAYNLQQKRLTQIFGRVLGLGTNRLRQLSAWQAADGPDFATCVQLVMEEAEFDPPDLCNEVTLEEIDLALTEIAANSVSSGPEIRARANEKTPFDVLRPIIVRLQSHEAKWLVKMIMKSYNPVDIPEYAALYGFHFMLPKLLDIQNSFEAAVAILCSPDIIKFPSRPSKEYEVALLPFLAREIHPKWGTMVRRQPLNKARSIKHCLKMAGSRIMSVERKYDGEYCQVHVDKCRASGRIQVFSKSGRDSTLDRFSLHGAIKAGLKLDTPECKIKRQAILEGELVVYSRIQKLILPFYHIRKHVRHGGKWIGTEADSPRRSGEQLMIIFFDILLLDEKVMINQPHRIRRQHLKGLVSQIVGTSLVVERALIDFKARDAPIVLRKAFAAAIRKRWEGFVLKDIEDPYLSWKEETRGIKMKKDYIAGLGDTADVCVVGGRRNAGVELDLRLGKLQWTHFYIACLVNKVEVRRYGDKPSFIILDCIGPGNMSRDDILVLNSEGKLVEREFVFESGYMTVSHPRRDLAPPTHMYTSPIVIELMGAGYERPQTVNFYVLRFPRTGTSNLKMHKDRSIADTVSFDELQAQAKKSITEPEDFHSQEDAEWIEKLLAADPKPKYIVDKSQSTSPSKTPHSATTISLTPGTARHASTQPSPLFVRIDKTNITFCQPHGRYPNSMPQTPSRYSESTLSPVTTGGTMSAKRRLNYTQESPTMTPRLKRKRVGFAANVSIDSTAFGMPLSEMSNPALAVAHNTTMVAAAKQGKENDNHKAISTESALDKLRVTQYGGQEVTAGVLAMSSAAEGKGAPHGRNESEDKIDEGVIHTHQTQQRPTVDTPALFKAIMAPITTVSYHVQVRQPVLVTSSITRNTTISKIVRSRLRIQRIKYTLSSNSFLASSATSQPFPLQTRSKYIVLIDSTNTPQAVTDLRRLAKLFLNQTICETDHWSEIDILVFDYRILLTSFARWGLNLDIDLARRDGREEQRFDFGQCEQWFCGVLERRKQAIEHTSVTGPLQTDVSVRLNLELSVQQAFVTGFGEAEMIHG